MRIPPQPDGLGSAGARKAPALGPLVVGGATRPSNGRSNY